MVSIFRSKDKVPEKASGHTSQPAPGTSIYYDPGLISHLKSDHRKMLETFKKVQNALALEDFRGVQQNLGEFRAMLQEHLLTENVRLYVYLSKQLANDEVNFEIINGFRREMQEIGRVVMDFVRRYTGTQIDGSAAPKLKTELEQIGQALVARMQREEGSLYPLYMESY